ncbi:hypothetical protein OGAPHI_006842 [Ogataea philodendri]|uniref:Amidase domain-containing protein n=2 Tax=Saccharomycotina TaxID=147537 RepID=A0A9P8NXQ8_9ASCO|nr:uncharacterized protein OGAPHI_006842 [Ogataea philodendri]KAH3661435.1 hypothetical protein OGAPHI_006842 [Ogataea philodendri]
MLVLVLLLSVASALSVSKQVKLGNISYYVPDTPWKTFTEYELSPLFGELKPSFLFPLTVLNETSLNYSVVQTLSDDFSEKDDVFSEFFLENIFLNSGDSVSSTKNHSLSGFNVSSVSTLSTALPNGPYFASYLDGVVSVFPAYRLYADTHAAFQIGIVPSGDGFMALPAGVEVAHAQTIAVPSRLYYTPTDEQPLAGFRIGVKDLYDIAGIKTGGSSRHYYDVYDPANATCPSIQRLIDLGAVIVGKLKLTQFANGETATADYVDYHAPFNPRGDGYQSPSSSSCGSGAAEAAYDWLDVTIGSDTGCSVRCPASAQGIFGLRPTFDAITLEGVIPMNDVMDTAGYLTRTAEMFRIVGEAWYAENANISTDYIDFPTTVYTFEGNNTNYIENEVSEDALNIFYDFVDEVTEFLNGTHEKLNLFDEFDKTGEDILDVFNHTWSGLAGYYQYVHVWEPFAHDYQQKFNNDTPFLDPVPKFRWDWGYFNLTEEGYNKALDNKQLFDDWWNENVTASDPDTCSSSLYIYLTNGGATTYRNKYLKAPSETGLSGFSELYISSFARTPEAVVPLAELPYNSTITLTEKYLPVAAAIGAAPGCDFMVLDLIEQLTIAGIINDVAAGPQMYP